MTANQSLVECYQDAALQRYLMRPVAHDHPGPVFYAIDTNVIFSFLEPRANAIAFPDRLIGMGEIFRADSQTTKEAIAAELLSRMMTELSPETAFITLWPIDGEVQRLFERYRNKMTRGPIEHDDEAAVLHAKIVKAHPDIAEILSLDFVKRASWLSGTFTALSRLLVIAREGLVLREAKVSPDTHGAQLSWALKAAVPPFSAVGQTFEYSQKRMLWRDRFTKIGRADTELRENDVEALTRLEMTNALLEKAEKESRKGSPGTIFPRLMYITSDNSVMRAAESYDWHSSGQRGSFAFKFIRHPRAFLDTLGILRTISRSEEGPQETIYDWLTVLLGRFDEMLNQIPSARGRIDFDAALVDNIKEVEARDAGAAAEIQRSWARFAADAVSKPAEILTRLQEAAESGANIDASGLIAELQRDEREAWLMVLEVSVAARFAVEVATPQLDVPRDAPVLIMHDRPQLTAFLSAAANWLEQPADYSHDEYRALREEVRREEAENTPPESEAEHSYGDFVAHAYLLAHQGQWKTAAILAALASDSISRSPVPLPSGNNGRESSYVEACCLRLTAANRADLDVAERHCQRAITLVNLEFNGIPPAFDDLASLVATNHGVGKGQTVDPVSERFVAELVAIRTMALEFEWFDTKNPAGPERRVQIRHDILAIAELFFELARQSSRRLETLAPHSLSKRALRKVVEMCCRAGLSLYLQLGDLTAPDLWNRLGDVVQMLKEQDARTTTTELSRIVLALVDVAKALPSRASRKALEQMHLSHPVLSFDPSRLTEMVANVRTVI